MHQRNKFSFLISYYFPSVSITLRCGLIIFSDMVKGLIVIEAAAHIN